MFPILQKWYLDGTHTDLNITIRSCKNKPSSSTIAVHKCIVGFRSAVLHRMISEPHVDPPGGLARIVLWNEDVENFRILLSFMYGWPILQEIFVPCTVPNGTEI